MTFGVVSVAMEVTITIWAQPSKPKRINQAIELLAECQPIYYTGSQSGTAGAYKQGMKDAQTYADYISYAVLPLNLSLPLQQLLKFIQRQMVKESITAIDEARDPAVRNVTHNFRILFEINCSGFPRRSCERGNRKYSLKRSRCHESPLSNGTVLMENTCHGL
jgi:hypothetical protein